MHEGQLDDITLSTFAFAPFVQLRFVGTNFLSDGGLSDNLRTKHPENTLSDTSLYAELVRLFHAATLPVTFFASASTAAK